MKKTYFLGLAIIAVIVLGMLAVPKTMADKQTKEDRSVTIDGATPENPVVYLGKAFDRKSGKEVEGYAIVHYARSAIKKVKPIPTPTPTVCYGFLAEGARWKNNVEPWTVDEANTGGIDPNTEFNILDQGITKWENAAGTTEMSPFNILGTGTQGTVSNVKALGKKIDGKNEVTFAPIRTRGAIAVTYIWGIFGGDISQRQLTEWDQIYNTGFAWSASANGETNKMDFDNIATHELGHSVGMNDLYTSGCSTQTMYGYASEGQDNKRTLESEDITGIDLLYQ